MDMAERKGSVFLRKLLSADRLSDRAIFRGLLSVNTPPSRASALLSLVTRPDQYFFFMKVNDISCEALNQEKDQLSEVFLKDKSRRTLAPFGFSNI